MINVKGTRIVKGFSTSVDTQHLGKTFLTRPADLGMLTDQIYANKTVSDWPLYSHLMSLNKVQTIESHSWPDFTYKIPQAKNRPVVVLGDVMGAGTKHGYGKTEFEIYVDEPYLVPSDEITPGNIDVQLRIKSAAQKYGSGWKHTVQPKALSNTTFIDPKYFQAGMPWTKLWATGEEGNQQKGSTMFYNPGLTLNSKAGKFNKHFKLTDFAMMNTVQEHRQVIVAKGNKAMTLSLTMAEDNANREWMMELNRACWFSKAGTEVYGSTNREVNYMTGVYYQVKDNGWQMGYTVLTAKLILEFFKKIQFGRTVRKESKTVRIHAGEIALQAFSEGVLDSIGKLGFALLSQNFVRPTTSDAHPQALEYGAAFTAWRLPNGTLVELVHEPAFDDINLHYEIDPLTGYPKMSGTLVALDVSGTGSDANLRLVEPISGGHYSTYRMGNVDLPGFSQGKTYVASSEDAMSVNYTRNMGMILADPTSTGIMFSIN